jgi:hypothetical protein
MHPERRPNPGRSPEPLEARLRALPRLPVPAGLEARLLAAVPAARPAPRRRWGVWAGVAGALVAACLLAVLAWPKGDGKGPGPEVSVPTPRVTPRPTDDSADLAALLKARRDLDEAETTPFSWPLPETPPVTAASIPPDLLD